MDLQMALTRLSERAKTDAAFRAECEADFLGVLARETGLAETAVREQLQRLSDEALAGVAGGLGADPVELFRQQLFGQLDGFFTQGRREL